MAIRRRDGKTGTRFEVYRKASGRNAYVGTYDNERAARGRTAGLRGHPAQDR